MSPSNHLWDQMEKNKRYETVIGINLGEGLSFWQGHSPGCSRMVLSLRHATEVE